MSRVLYASLVASLASLTLFVAPSLAAAAPTATTGPATVVQQTTATLNGFVDDHGRKATYYFQFGTSTHYGSRTSSGTIGSNRRSAPVARGAAGLTPDTTYHYRIVATSSSGTGRGADRTFHTPPIPTHSTIAVYPNPMVFGGVLTIYGSLAGPPPSKNANKSVELQANVWPFTGGFRQFGNVEKTDQNGAYLFQFAAPAVFLPYDTQFRVFDLSMPSVVSPTIEEGVIPIVKLHVHRGRRLRHGFRERFSGTLTPAQNGQAVFLQERAHGKWKTVATLLTRPRGSTSIFARTLRLRHGGVFRIMTAISNFSATNVASRPHRVG